MKRSLKFLALLAVLSAMPSCSWFSKHPVIPAVVTCSGETIPIALVTQTYNDVMTENWIDLAENVVPLLKDGYADLQCVWNYLGTSNPETLPHINTMKAKHAAEFKGSASCSGSPTVVVARLSADAVACARRCGEDGWSWGSAGCVCRKSEALRSPGDVTPKTGTFAYPGENPGAALERCDRTCGEHLTSLATVKGCLCWRGKGRAGHWVALREAPGLGMVASR